jgi:hypothetical protein
MLVKFDHSINISMPDVCTSHYQLLKDFTKFLSHIHGLNAFKDDLQKVDLPIDQDLTKTKEGRDLNNAIHHAVPRLLLQAQLKLFQRLVRALSCGILRQ